MKILALSLFALIIVTNISSTQASESQCLDRIQSQLDLQSDTQNRLYRRLDPKGQGIKPENRTRFYRGVLTGKAVLVIHGMIASPWEVEALSKSLNESGYTVLAPLLSGFGGSTEVANRLAKKAGYTPWRKHVTLDLALLSECFDQVSVVGFSLGGTLATDLALRSKKVNSLVLLAPYFRMKEELAAALDKVISSVTDSLPLSLLVNLTKNADLEIPRENPDFYNQSMPLEAVKAMMSLSTDVIRAAHSKELSLPTLLAYSEDDQTININFASQFASQHFSNLNKWIIPAREKVRHQILVPYHSYEPAVLIQALTQFIQSQNTQSH